MSGPGIKPYLITLKTRVLMMTDEGTLIERSNFDRLGPGVIDGYRLGSSKNVYDIELLK